MSLSRALSVKGKLRSADGGLRTADCGLRTADCELQTADCTLQIADSRLRTADCTHGGKMKSDGKVQTTDFRLFRRISCYCHYRVPTINRGFQDSRRETCTLKLV